MGKSIIAVYGLINKINFFLILNAQESALKHFIIKCSINQLLIIKI